MTNKETFSINRQLGDTLNSYAINGKFQLKFNGKNSIYGEHWAEGNH